MNSRVFGVVIIAALPWISSSFADEAITATEHESHETARELIEHPIAILPFRERGEEVRHLGGQAADLLFARLVADPALNLVEREELDKTLDEAALNLSGVVSPTQANEVGRLTGAQLIVTGSVFQVESKIYLVAKIIGAETTRVAGASVKGPLGDGVAVLAERLGDEVVETIKKNAGVLVPLRTAPQDRIAALREKMGDADRPTLFIDIEEQHAGTPVIDPAAETEFITVCRSLGFDVIDSKRGSPQQADMVIEGEGLSEFAGRHGDLVSVKARLEIKIVVRDSGKIIAADRQTRIVVDLAERIAGKAALQEAAMDLAERVLPKILSHQSE